MQKKMSKRAKKNSMHSCVCQKKFVPLQRFMCASAYVGAFARAKSIYRYMFNAKSIQL